jgi:predicted Fe-Mo cluster-binding NifX family protein
MRICIPTETDNGKTAKVCGHFGSAPFFTIYDDGKDTFEVIDNPNKHHVHGTCRPTSVLIGKNINIVVCGGMGVRAIQDLNKKGIRVYRATADIVEEVITRYEHGRFEEITIEDACSQHNCH